MDYFDFVLKMLSIVIFTFLIVSEIKFLFKIFSHLLFLIVIYFKTYKNARDEIKLKVNMLFEKRYNNDIREIWINLIFESILFILLSIPLYFIFNYLFY